MRILRIRIHTDESDLKAVKRVMRVIEEGQISKTKKHGEQYCFVTKFADETGVECKKHAKGFTFSIYPPAP